MKHVLGTESGIGLAEADDWDVFIALIERFGRDAEAAATRFDFGIAPSAIRCRMDTLVSDARRIQRATWDALPGGRALKECLEALRKIAPSTHRKSIARIGGVFAIHAYFRPRMTEEAIGRAIAASSFYEMAGDVMDDILDGGGWTFTEATRFYDRCLRPLTDPSVSIDELEGDLADWMGPGQEGLEHILATAIRELRQLLASSDARIHRLIGEGHEALARGQAATVYLRREAFNLPAVREIAAGLLASDASLSWLDRLAICVSWTKHIPLFDAGLTSTPIQDAELTANAHAWRAIDQAVTLLEHFAGTEKDLREGVINVACLQANLSARLLEPIPFSGYAPDERQAVFDKATECLVRAVREGVEGSGPREEYLFLALMTPIIIFAFSRTPAEQADAFLETLSPALRAMAEQATLLQEVGIPA